MNRKTAPYVLVLAALLLACLSWRDAAANPGTRYVKEAGYTDGYCNSWQNACELQHALLVALYGDQIWVAQGTYYPGVSGDRTATFQLKEGVAIYGGFSGNESSLGERDWVSNQVILSGDLNDNGTDDSDSYHVVTGASGAILDGVTVSGGNANGSDPDERGGGMYNYYASPSLTNVTFKNNVALNAGGMYNEGSYPSLMNVIFWANTADSGGGMYNIFSDPSLMNVTFFANYASIGAGMVNRNISRPNLTNVTFSANLATDYGGGIYNYNSDIDLVNVTFRSNWAGESGGGMRNYLSDPTLTNVTFSGNTSQFGGGIGNNMSNPSLTNVTMLNNHAPTGNGIYNDATSSSTLVNCIVWGDGNQIEGLASVTYSDIARNEGLPPFPGEGNIMDDPLLAPLSYNGGLTQNYALLPGSPAINAGTNNGCPASDQRGTARPISGTCDMGSYEYGFMLFTPLVTK